MAVERKPGGARPIGRLGGRADAAVDDAAFRDVPPDAGTAPDPGAACLARLLMLYGMPGDPERLRRLFAHPGRPMDAACLVRAARRLGLKARTVRRDWKGLAGTPLPAIAQERGGGFFLLAGVREDAALIQTAAGDAPRRVDRQELDAMWTGQLVLTARRLADRDTGGLFGVGWFVPALLKYRKLFGEVILASFFIQLLALATPLVFQVVIDKVLVHHGLTTLDVLVVALCAIGVFEVILTILRTYLFSHTTNRVDVELGAKLFRHLLALPLGYFQARRVGDSVARVRELETIRDFLTGSTLTLVIDLAFTVVFFAVMWMFSPTLTMIVLAALPFYVGLAVVVTPALRARIEEKFHRGAVNQAFLVETVTAIETVKALAVEPRSQLKWEEQLAAYVHASFRTAQLGAVAGQITQLINKLTIAATLYFGALAVIAGTLTVGQLVAFNMLAARVTGPILRLAQLWNDFQQARVSIARLGDILNTPTEPQYNPNRGALSRIEGRIRFRDVWFRYQPGGRDVLAGVDLEIPSGQVIGVVGPSGSGKSTLARLVQRMHAPTQGAVLIDGVDVASVDVSWLRGQIGVVLQENALFNGTIRENIAIADPACPFDQVVRAATIAGAHDFIGELSEGYDTEVGERGANLSGGQRQRIAIARAILGDPRILIFDEATSALDYESEQIIQSNMRMICAQRTVVIIAHRLSAVRDADRILTVEGGRIVEDGTHDELIKAGGRYANLWRIQVGAIMGAA